MTLEKISLASADGASAEVYAYGAHVTSWRPVPDREERLFLSGRSVFSEGTAIRGGIPVIFPQFAAEGPLPRHGFARTMQWTVASPRDEPGGAAAARFTLASSDETRRIWPAEFLATVDVEVVGAQLRVSFTVDNTGADAFSFAAALHTYLRISDVRQAELVGLHGARYRVASSPDSLAFEDSEVLRFDGEIDRVYVGAPARVALRDGERHLDIETTGFEDVVVWNPGAAAAALADMEPGGEARMLCVEAAQVQNRITLDGGRRWTGSQTLTAQPAP